MSDTELRVFSLNCWGLKYVSRDRSERIDAIATFLARSQYDIVALQELWLYADYEIVRASVSKRLPFTKFFYSGALGAGLAIFSSFPIVAASIQAYSLNGSPIDVIAGDWFVGKAAASVLITHPVLGQVQVFNTHLFAKGGERGPEHHRAHRLVNAWEFAKLVKQSAELGRFVIAAGDFNSIPTTLPMTVIRDHACLRDAWAETHAPPPPAIATPDPSLTPADAIRLHGITADSPLNSYSAGKIRDVYTRAAYGKRLDYVLFRNPAPHPFAPTFTPKLPTLVCSDARVMLTEAVPGKPFSHSDHFGLEATLVIKHPEAQEATLPSDAAVGASLSTDPAPSRGFHSPRLSAESATAVLEALTGCYRHARARSWLVFIVGAAMSHSAFAPLFVFCGALVTWLGTTMLYVGFVYGKWEVNALMNAIEELELYRRSVDDGFSGRSQLFMDNRH
ncbi:inositol phosphophingolipids phospholipase C [Artomyces pyxidatus]|uniref:Inositol phosphophingolipids phospholipase C n=1 Tax=Artomyces pyxidatus TaxID=48021 RepID=A0ACB8TCN7_9AGAM|nr:inositol phosphophingolipids phospholipase C [Artomyces pyxidatus]